MLIIALLSNVRLSLSVRASVRRMLFVTDIKGVCLPEKPVVDDHEQSIHIFCQLIKTFLFHFTFLFMN